MDQQHLSNHTTRQTYDTMNSHLQESTTYIILRLETMYRVNERRRPLKAKVFLQKLDYLKMSSTAESRKSKSIPSPPPPPEGRIRRVVQSASVEVYFAKKMISSNREYQPKPQKTSRRIAHNFHNNFASKRITNKRFQQAFLAHSW